LLKGIAAALAAGDDQLRFCLSNPTEPDRNVGADLTAFIRSSGGQHYLDAPGDYQVERYLADTGDPPEPTAIALVFARDASEQPLDEDAQGWLDRGQQWEALGRWPDALQCYQMAVEQFPKNPELLFRLGRACMHLPGQLPRAYPHLREAHERAPERPAYARQLALCLMAVADDEAIEVRGTSREALRSQALLLLEAAVAADPGDSEAGEALASLQRVLGVDDEDVFFSEP